MQRNGRSEPCRSESPNTSIVLVLSGVCFAKSKSACCGRSKNGHRKICQQPSFDAEWVRLPFFYGLCSWAERVRHACTWRESLHGKIGIREGRAISEFHVTWYLFASNSWFFIAWGRGHCFPLSARSNPVRS